MLFCWIQWEVPTYSRKEPGRLGQLGRVYLQFLSDLLAPPPPLEKSRRQSPGERWSATLVQRFITNGIWVINSRGNALPPFSATVRLHFFFCLFLSLCVFWFGVRLSRKCMFSLSLMRFWCRNIQNCTYLLQLIFDKNLVLVFLKTRKNLQLFHTSPNYVQNVEIYQYLLLPLLTEVLVSNDGTDPNHLRCNSFRNGRYKCPWWQVLLDSLWNMHLHSEKTWLKQKVKEINLVSTRKKL